MPALPPSLRALSRRLAVALLWVVLLGGVFAMHGLGTHGIGGASSVAGAPLMAMDHAASAMHDAMPSGNSTPDQHHTGLAMMCLAILIAATVVASMARLLRRRPVFTAARLRVRFLPRPGTTHPPPLAHFSVMRC